ncbi:hypothetical protein FOVSG1_007169 [Fusarium oxysporum f. sp. vasinfectum]
MDKGALGYRGFQRAPITISVSTQVPPPNGNFSKIPSSEHAAHHKITNGDPGKSKMVYYFTSNVVDPPGFIYVGKDKFENEDLIKFGWEEDIWVR